jgi:hypothetical protein
VTTRKLFSAIFLLAFLPTLGISANTHGDDQAARERVRIAVRWELHLKLDQFLRVQEDEALERRLAEIVARPSWSASIYKVSEEGDEIKDHVIVHHIVMDGDPTFTVAMNPASENVYRIQGFSDSLAEFNKLMRDADLKVAGSDQAEAVAGFYQQVNPQRSSVAQMSSLPELKQAAERQCQAIPFDPRERNFEAWWKHAKAAYAKASFQQTATHSGSGYAVEWVVLSSPGDGLCGGAALRARLEVGSDGSVGEISFRPL